MLILPLSLLHFHLSSMFLFSYGVRVFVFLGMFRGNARSVGMKDEVCNKSQRTRCVSMGWQGRLSDSWIQLRYDFLTMWESSGRLNGTGAIENGFWRLKSDNLRCLFGSIDSIVVDIENKQFVQLCISYVMDIIHKILENFETCCLFVEKLRVEALFKLLPWFNGA